MNVADVRAALEKNKKPLAIGGVLLVGGLGLLKARSGGTAPAATPASARSAAVKPTGAAVSGYAGGYDSSSSDLANALEAINTRLTEATAPVPVPADPFSGFKEGLYKVAGGTADAYYWLDTVRGTRDWLAPTEIEGMRQSGQLDKATALPNNHWLWSKTSLIGIDNPKSSYYWHGADTPNATPTTPKAAAITPAPVSAK